MIENTKTFNGHTYTGVQLSACLNGYEQGTVDTIDKCAQIISSMNDICKFSCPIGCEWNTEEGCIESWKLYLSEQIREQNGEIID